MGISAGGLMRHILRYCDAAMPQRLTVPWMQPFNRLLKICLRILSLILSNMPKKN